MSSFWQEVLARPREIYAKLSRGQRLGVLALLSVGLVVAALGAVLAGRENYVMLCGGLDPTESAEITSKLTSDGVPYRLSPDGSMIQVPEARKNEIRMQLAGAGLPKRSSPGFELFDSNQIGLTDSLFNVNMQRAVQGELERAIETCDAVKKAIVLVQLQASNVFLREKGRPTASVFLTLRPGRPLSDTNLAAIAHLVSFTIGKGMRPQDVTISDNELHLLHPRGDENDPYSTTAYLDKVQGIERYLQEKAESQIRAAVGEGKAAVRVNVDLDLTQKEKQTETPVDSKALVKKVTSNDSSGGTPAKTGGDTSVAAPPGKADQAAAAAPSVAGETHNESEEEYRQGVTRELQVIAPGSIRHMSVSLLLDDSDPSLKDVQKLGEIVKAAVGFVEAKPRADSFTVTTLPFAKPAPAPKPPGPFALENLLPLVGHVTEAVTVLFVLFLLQKGLRGALHGRPAKAKGVVAGVAATGGGETTEEEDWDLVVGADGKGPDLRARLGRFVEKHPDQAREVIVAWLKEELTP